MIRSIVAVVVGFLFIGLLSFGMDAVLKTAMPQVFNPASGRIESAPVLLLVITYVLAFAVAGCYLTARLAPRKPLKHALVLGALGLIFNIAGSLALWHTAPAWYHIVSLLLVMPAAWLGGRLRESQLQGQPSVA